MQAARFEFIALHTVVDHPEYVCELEEYRRPDGLQFLLCHVRFTRFSPDIWRCFLREWSVFRPLVKCHLFCTGEVQDDKWRKFVARLGFTPLREVICQNGDRRWLYVNLREPDGQSDPRPETERHVHHDSVGSTA